MTVVGDDGGGGNGKERMIPWNQYKNVVEERIRGTVLGWCCDICISSWLPALNRMVIDDILMYFCDILTNQPYPYIQLGIPTTSRKNHAPNCKLPFVCNTNDRRLLHLAKTTHSFGHTEHRKGPTLERSEWYHSCTNTPSSSPHSHPIRQLQPHAPRQPTISMTLCCDLSNTTFLPTTHHIHKSVLYRFPRFHPANPCSPRGCTAFFEICSGSHKARYTTSH